MQIGISGLRIGGGRAGGLRGLALYDQWFLNSGTWDNDGLWADIVPWESEWFLERGSINPFGFWDEAEAW